MMLIKYARKKKKGGQMDKDRLQILISMCSYLVLVVVIGLYYAKRANESSENYFIGGRTLGPWITALSAEASDMSGWLLMGLPGVAYFFGLSDAFWTAIGLSIGTYLNWLFVAKRLRHYSKVAGDSITVPDYLSNRFKENKKVIMTIAALFILIFFTVYASSCFVTVGKLFSAIFDLSYHWMMILGALFVLFYTIVGGFLAESASDFLQAVVMIFALVVVFAISVVKGGGVGAISENIQNIPGFLEFFGIAQPTLQNGAQVVENGKPLFSAAGKYGFLTVISTMSWGLGYFGMPQVLIRFMAIRDSQEIKKSRRIAIVWCVISLAAAVLIGLIGRALYPSELLTQSASESIFIVLSTRLMPPLIAGIVMAGILAATISSSDSYLLIATSAISKNLFQGVLKKDATDKQVMWVSRIIMLLIALVGVLIALDENSIIFKVVSFAWAGFGATFGPIILFSLFWKRTTQSGAIFGMLAGGISVFVWNLLIKPLGGVFGIYELLPAFVISGIVIVIASLATPKPSDDIIKDFEHVKALKRSNA